MLEMKLVPAVPLAIPLNFGSLQVALLAVELALLAATVVLIFATRRELKARDALMQHVSMATEAITRQEYFETVIAAIRSSRRQICAVVTGTNPSPEEAEVLKVIMDTVKQACSDGVQIRYLLPSSPDRLEMARRYRLAGAEVMFHPDLLVNDARFMIVDDRAVIIGVPAQDGRSMPTKHGHSIASESIAHVFRERFEKQWHSADAISYTDFLSELVTKARRFNPEVSSDVIAHNLRIAKEDIEHAESASHERQFGSTA